MFDRLPWWAMIIVAPVLYAISKIVPYMLPYRPAIGLQAAALFISMLLWGAAFICAMELLGRAWNAMTAAGRDDRSAKQ